MTGASRIQQVDVIVVGHLRWNRYFGETAQRPPRGFPSTCTSTLVRGLDGDGQPYALLVDPTWRSTPSEYYFDLNRRTGLLARDITHVFITHHHQDHVVGANYFAGAQWCAAPDVVDLLASSEDIDSTRIKAVDGEMFPGLTVQHLPGHTEMLHGLVADWFGRRIAIVGDAVMTRHHYAQETSEFQWDADMAAETIRWLKRASDVVIPGHDNIIVNWR